MVAWALKMRPATFVGFRKKIVRGFLWIVESIGSLTADCRRSDAGIGGSVCYPVFMLDFEICDDI